jgi:hypothetical protein
MSLIVDVHYGRARAAGAEIVHPPRELRKLRVALLLGPQSADRSVMHSKRPGDIR